MSIKRVFDREDQIALRSIKDTNSQPSRRVSWLEQILERLSYKLLERKDPKVRQVRDRSGKIYWEVYDPVSRRSLFFSSEQDIRIWLERWHYH
jgi:hypothetical protein